MKLCPFRLATFAGQNAIAIQIIASESQMMMLMIVPNDNMVMSSTPRIPRLDPGIENRARRRESTAGRVWRFQPRPFGSGRDRGRSGSGASCGIR